MHHRRVKSSRTAVSSCLGDCASSKSSIHSDTSRPNASVEPLSSSTVSSLPSRQRMQPGTRLVAKLRKKSTILNGSWKEYFFVLQGGFIEYYSSESYVESEGSYLLLNCTVGNVKKVRWSGGKLLYTIKIAWCDNEQQQMKQDRKRLDDDRSHSRCPSGTSGTSGPQTDQSPGLNDFVQNGAAVQKKHKWPKRTKIIGGHGSTPVSRHKWFRFLHKSDDPVADNAALQSLVDQQETLTNSSPIDLDSSSVQPEDDENGTVVSKHKHHGSTSKVLGYGAAAVVGAGIGAVTMGAGLVFVVALVAVGAGATSAAGGGAHFYESKSKKRHTLHIGSESVETIMEWRDTIRWEIERMETCEFTSVDTSQEPSAHITAEKTSVQSETKDSPSSKTYFNTNELVIAGSIIRHQDWMFESIQNGTRVYVARGRWDVPVGTIDSFPAKDKPTLMCRVQLDSSTLEALSALLASPDANAGGFWRSMRVVKRINDNTDIIEMTCGTPILGSRALLCAHPRVFYLARFWHLDKDGNYFLEMASCYNDESASSLSTSKGFTRGLLRSIYTIAAKQDSINEMPCLVTHYCQCDPMGIIGYSEYFSHLYACNALLSMVDVKNALDYEVFQHFKFDNDLLPIRQDGFDLIYNLPRTLSSIQDTSLHDDLQLPLSSSTFEGTFFDVGSFHTFQLRGKDYMVDSKKIPGGESVGRLVRCDVFQLSPGERADYISSMGRCSQIVHGLISPGNTLFVLNYQLYKPSISFVAVWKVPDGEGSPEFQKLWKQFIDLPEGLNDNGGLLPHGDFRSKRFKLIPKVVSGPWIVRKTVGCKPALLAQKLTCRFFSRPGIFELDLDINSSTIASNSVSLAQSHSKKLTVDMGVTIQGENKNELPESLIGAVRLAHLDLSLAEPLMPPPRSRVL